MNDTLQRAWQLYRFRRYPLALEETVKFLGQYPESAEAHCLLALVHGKEKRQKQAFEAAEAAIRFSPDWSYPHYVHALVAYWFKKYELALRSLSEALRIQPNDPDFYELVSAIHADEGHVETSTQMAERGLENDPQHVGCLYHRAVAHFMQNKMDEAETDFRTILSIDPEHPHSSGFIGHFEIQKGNFQKALPLLRNALREDPDWELAQTAWKESLRSKYRLYGAVTRLRKWMYENKRQVILVIFVIVCSISYVIAEPHNQRAILMPVFLIISFGAFIALLIFIGGDLLLAGYLNLISRVLLFTDPELRRSFDWKEKIKDYRNILYIFIGIMLGILMMALTSKSKP